MEISLRVRKLGASHIRELVRLAYIEPAFVIDALIGVSAPPSLTNPEAFARFIRKADARLKGGRK